MYCLYGICTAQVIEIREGNKSYKFGPGLTNKWLYVVDGVGVKRLMQMANVSSKPITEQEYDRYLRHCNRVRKPPMSKAQVEEALERIRAAAK